MYSTASNHFHIRRLNSLFGFLTSLVMTLSLASISLADDTDIFFSQAEGDPSTHPNIVFVLDNSGSMAGRIPSTSQKKLDAMKEAMNNIIDSVEDIHLGLAKFQPNDPEYGTTQIHPVTWIEAPGARDSLKSAVNSIGHRTVTPLVGALYEAAMILRGGNIQETAATYTSPMVGECQNSHIVVLSDGQAWQNKAVAKTQSLIGGTCPNSGYRGYETCGVELAQWLNTTDHVPSIPREKNISVSTIGFNISSSFLERVANAGGGQYYEASRADELESVFSEIVTEVKELDTTFVAPASSINQFNRLAQSNDLYFSMFKPQSRATWPGNLKKYQLGYDGSNIIITDANGNQAVDPVTGQFLDSARSFWSGITDGKEVQLGGAAGELISGDRLIYTHVGSLPSNGSGVDLTNLFTPGSTASDLYLQPLPADEREKVVRWVRGEDVDDEYPGLERRHMGDVLHSNPVSVHYPGRSLVYVGTNEGFLHAIRQGDGKEHFSFIPQELIPNLINFYTNQGGVRNRPYGLDGEISFYHDDTNGDSIVNQNETALLFIGMRRGGNDYYALDVSNPDRPRLKWRIDGGVGDYARLGQTWSRPIPTKIFFSGAERLVLIFGGGYSTEQDPENYDPNRADSVGNSVFIADANNGELIWSAYDDVPGVSAHMKYSIPSDLRVIDINGDDFADRIYVGDLGGNVWRFDIKAYHQSGGYSGNLVQGGRLASFLNRGSRSRFYNEPDVALGSQNGKRFMSVSIGSGWRANPLSTEGRDWFYMIRDSNPLTTPSSWNDPIRANDLENVTGSLSTDASRQSSPDKAGGWMLMLNNAAGEKNLSRSITINNQVLFTTFAPIAATDICSAPSGQAFVYALSTKNGDPVLPLSSGSSNLSTADRSKVLATQSIPPGPTAAIADVGGGIRTSVMVGGETPLNDLPFSDLTQRTYWQDNRRGNLTPAECRAAGGC